MSTKDSRFTYFERAISEDINILDIDSKALKELIEIMGSSVQYLARSLTSLSDQVEIDSVKNNLLIQKLNFKDTTELETEFNQFIYNIKTHPKNKLTLYYLTYKHFSNHTLTFEKSAQNRVFVWPIITTLQFKESTIDTLSTFSQTFHILNIGLTLLTHFSTHNRVRYKNYEHYKSKAFETKKIDSFISIHKVSKQSPLIIELTIAGIGGIWALTKTIELIVNWKLNRDKLKAELSKINLENKKLEYELKELDKAWKKLNQEQNHILQNGLEKELNEYDTLILKELNVNINT